MATRPSMADVNLPDATRLLYFRRRQTNREITPVEKRPTLFFHETQNEANPWKQGGGAFSAYNFFEYTIGLLIIFGFTLAYKLIFRTPWRDPRTADCTTGRRILDTEEIIMLDEYYKQPMWKRFLTYVQLW